MAIAAERVLPYNGKTSQPTHVAANSRTRMLTAWIIERSVTDALACVE